jgi:signal recognition particle receptor subunit beta
LSLLFDSLFVFIVGLFYVVDSSDKERMNDAKDELYRILDESEMRNVPVIIIANKQDLPSK